MKEEIEDKDVIIKMSLCGECKNIVRVAVKHMMTTKSKNSFLKECMEHNLSIKEMPLLKYRSDNPASCKCK